MIICTDDCVRLRDRPAYSEGVADQSRAMWLVSARTPAEYETARDMAPSALRSDDSTTRWWEAGVDERARLLQNQQMRAQEALHRLQALADALQ